MTGARRVALAVLGAAAVAASMAQPAAAVSPFGLTCKPMQGVRFCPMTSYDQRVPSFDGVPLDLDVTLPATGEGNFPTVVMLHGLTGDKSFTESETVAGDTSVTADFNNLFYAKRGYAVITATARGFNASCGTPGSRRGYPACGRGWLHMGDRRFEARDTQSLLGDAVDSGLADPSRLGVIGMSYGGGQAMQIAFLKDQVALPDGSFAPWTSAKGTPLSVKAVYSRMGWSDLASALQPNGRFDGVTVPTYEQGFAPIGVMKLTYGIVATVLALQGYIPSPGKDISADVLSWFGRQSRGEPYAGPLWDAMRATMLYKSIYGIPGTPAPLLLESAYNDDMLPADQSLRAYLLGNAAGGDVSIQLGDMGHPRASDDVEHARVEADRGADFMDAKLLGKGTAPAPGSALMWRFVCPKNGPLGDPITAPSYAELAKGEVTFGGGSWAAPVTMRSNPLQFMRQLGDDPLLPLLGPAIRKINALALHEPAKLLKALKGNGASIAGDASEVTNPCRVSSQTHTSRATYTGAVVTKPYTLAGMATAQVGVHTTGAHGVISARLWDVLPNGMRRFLNRAVYRQTPNQSGTATLHFNPEAYTFEVGHRPQVEIVVNDSPYLKPSSRPFTSVFGPVSVSLPTAEPTP